MGTVTSMAQKISLGCRPRTHSFEELKECYNDNRRSVIPMARAVFEEELVFSVNECGEEVVISVPKCVSTRDVFNGQERR
jgi:hypothetical protein